MTAEARNLLRAIAPDKGERFEPLLRRPGVQLEWICSAPGTVTEVMQQEHDEWVMLLQGKARLALGLNELTLVPGDSLLIPSGTPHQVTWTSTQPACVWLALHLTDRACDN